MTQSMGVPVIVEAKPGAGGNIGADTVAKAAPDGYTILMGTIGTNAINQTLYKSMPYQPLKDLVAVTQVVSYPLVVVVNPKLPINSVADLIAYAKSHPGELNRASGGSGTSMHMSGELFNEMAGIKMQHIPYKGSLPALTDVMGGQADLAFDSRSSPSPDQGGQAARHRRHWVQALAGRAGRAFGIGNAARLCDDVLDRRVRAGGHAAPGGGSSSAGDRQGPGRPQGQGAAHLAGRRSGRQHTR